MIYCLIGPPASGKGTIGAKLAEEYNIPKISTGEILRCLKDDKIAKTINNGNMITDELMNKILLDRISKKDCRNGFILDGYPRNIKQAIFLEKYIRMHKIRDAKVVYLDISVEQIKKRVLGRVQCEKCGKIYNKNTDNICMCKECNGKLTTRKDDTLEVLENRMEVYFEQTSKVIDFYEEKVNFQRVDASRNIPEIIESII